MKQKIIGIKPSVHNKLLDYIHFLEKNNVNNGRVSYSDAIEQLLKNHSRW